MHFSKLFTKLFNGQHHCHCTFPPTVTLPTWWCGKHFLAHTHHTTIPSTLHTTPTTTTTTTTGRFFRLHQFPTPFFTPPPPPLPTGPTLLNSVDLVAGIMALVNFVPGVNFPRRGRCDHRHILNFFGQNNLHWRFFCLFLLTQPLRQCSLPFRQRAAWQTLFSRCLNQVLLISRGPFFYDRFDWVMVSYCRHLWLLVLHFLITHRW